MTSNFLVITFVALPERYCLMSGNLFSLLPITIRFFALSLDVLSLSLSKVFNPVKKSVIIFRFEFNVSRFSLLTSKKGAPPWNGLTWTF